MKRLLIIGAAGAVCTPATIDLLRRRRFEEITVADQDVSKLENLAGQYSPGDPGVKIVRVNAGDPDAVGDLVAAHDLVCNGLPHGVSYNVLQACLRHGVSGADLGSTRKELAHDREGRERGIVYVCGCGATPGITNLMARAGANQLDLVESIHIHFAAFRSIALSLGLADTLLWEFEPNLEDRTYFADGTFHRVPALHSPKEVDFPLPIGRQTVYYVPHEETFTLPDSLGAKEVHVRGCFPPEAMDLVRSLTGFGMLEHTPSDTLSGLTPYDAALEIVMKSDRAKTTPVWGYGLEVVVTGRRGKERRQHRYWTTHPNQAEWGIPFAYSNNVGYSLATGVELIAEGNTDRKGVGGTESFLDPGQFFSKLLERGIAVHWQDTLLGTP